jgi:5-methylcytosine-specific restriction endonuclease McrA
VRTTIPDEIAAEVLYQHDRVCCVCNEPGKAVQIHHIDKDPNNHAPENLAALCLQHHDEAHITGGFGRKLRAVDIIKHRDEWTRRVRERRALADKIAVEKVATIVESTASAPPPQGGGSYTGHHRRYWSST